jgi:hypothetical protein
MVAFMVLTGFGSVSDQMNARMAQMPQHYSQFDVKMGWAVSGGNSSTTINGIIENVRYATMEDIEVWASLVDAKGKLFARSVNYIIPNRLNRGDFAPFTIILPSVAPTDTKLVFTYKYVGTDGGGHDADATSWMQSFESGM